MSRRAGGEGAQVAVAGLDEHSIHFQEAVERRATDARRRLPGEGQFTAVALRPRPVE